MAAGILFLALFLSGCRPGYLLHAAKGQFRALTSAVPVEEALLSRRFADSEVRRIRIAYRVRSFASEHLGLSPKESYSTLVLGSGAPKVYAVSAAPKDRLVNVTWWFPLVGRVPYLGFFDLAKAREEARSLAARNLDVHLGRAVAYSSLGWFRDPLTREMLNMPMGEFVETLIHEMVHGTLYLPGQGAFNEGLASLLGMHGALRFMEAHFGPFHPFSREARGVLEDERRFSILLGDLLRSLEGLYASPVGPEEKIQKREEAFSLSKGRFARLETRFRTDRFRFFAHMELNNASLLSIGLYHRHFSTLEAVHRANGCSSRKTLFLMRKLSARGGDALQAAKEWLLDQGILDRGPEDWSF